MLPVLSHSAPSSLRDECSERAGNGLCSSGAESAATYPLDVAGFRKISLCLSSCFLVCDLLQLVCLWTGKLVLWVTSDATVREAIAKTGMTKSQGPDPRVAHMRQKSLLNSSRRWIWVGLEKLLLSIRSPILYDFSELWPFSLDHPSPPIKYFPDLLRPEILCHKVIFSGAKGAVRALQARRWNALLLQIDSVDHLLGKYLTFNQNGRGKYTGNFSFIHSKTTNFRILMDYVTAFYLVTSFTLVFR